MKTLTDSRARRTVIGISTIALLALASVAGAMQEYEDLKTMVLAAKAEVEIEELDKRVSYLEALGISQFIFGIEQLSQILDQVDRLECQALAELSIAATKAEGDGNRAAGTRVRKQMQMIKQAAQSVRTAVVARYDLCQIPIYMDV